MLNSFLKTKFSSIPWLDHPDFWQFLSQGLFGSSSASVLQLKVDGFCQYRSAHENWNVDLVSLCNSFPISKTSLAHSKRKSLTSRSNNLLFCQSKPYQQAVSHLLQKSGLFDFIESVYGRRPFVSSSTLYDGTLDVDLSPNNREISPHPPSFFCTVLLLLNDSDVSIQISNTAPNPAVRIFNEDFRTISDLKSSPHLKLSYISDHFKPGIHKFKGTSGDIFIARSDLILDSILASGFQDSDCSVLHFSCYFEGCKFLKGTSNVSLFDISSGVQRPNLFDKFTFYGSPLPSPLAIKAEDSDSLPIYPLFEAPDFENRLSSGQFGQYSRAAKQMASEGFCKLQVLDPSWLKLIDLARQQLELFVDIKSLHQGLLPPVRFQDAWLTKCISQVKSIAIHHEILTALYILFGRSPFPFQTLNFPNGTTQHFHSDAVHFHALPHGFMCGVWVAFEDVSLDSGPLIYYPGSHRLPYLYSRDLGLKTSDIAGEPAPQKFFESYWRKAVEENQFKPSLFTAKKGDVLVWHSNLLHGGSPVTNRSLSRWSQVTHYYFEKCSYTTPMYFTTDSPIDGDQWRHPLNLTE